jgi:hypothetical protein
VPLLVGVQLLALVVDDVVMGGEEEAAGATGGVADGVVGRGLHHVHDGPDQLTGGEILAGAFRGLLGTFAE